MSSFNLGLPIDIPWIRVCYPDDMQNWETCEGSLPSQWKSSIAVSTYLPDGQATNPLIPPDPRTPDLGYVVSYVKITITLTPHSPDLRGDNGPTNFVLDQDTDYLPATYPCYGALLQVTVRPQSPSPWSDHKDWPYFVDLEPKSRELYEASTTTGESLMASSNSLSIGKSSSTTFGLQIPWNVASVVPSSSLITGSGAGTGLNIGSSSSTSSTTDSSTERRETQGYATQITQMYHLMEAFHMGTNRAMFLMEPRPHVLNLPATFLNGPRELEGIQEVFLVVAQRQYSGGIPALCFNVRLDTAHLWTEDQATPTDASGTPVAGGSMSESHSYSWHWSAKNQSWDSRSFTYTAPNGWTILSYQWADPGPLNLGIKQDQQIDVVEASDSKSITMTVHDDPLGPLQGFDQPIKGMSGTGTLQVTIAQLIANDQGANAPAFVGMFMTTRDLCCCDSEDAVTVQDSVTNTQIFPPVIPPILRGNPTGGPNLPTGGFPTGGPGIMTTGNIVTSRQIAQAIRNGMIKSTQSASTVPVGQVPFTQSDPYYRQLLNIGMKSNPDLTKQIALSTTVTPEQRDLLTTYFPGSTVESVIKTDSQTIANVTGMAFMDVLQMKDQMLRAAKPLPPPPPAVNPLRNIISVRVLSTYPNPSNPTLLYDMTDPRSLPTISVLQQPNIVEVTFSGNPDAGTVTTSSLLVTQGGATLPGTVQQLTLSKYRIVLTVPLAMAGTFGITLKGTGSSAITFGGLGLDGTPTGLLPSGNKIASGDFTSALNVIAPTPPPPPAPPVPTMLKITGVQITTTTGTPRLLADMVVPSSTLQVFATDIPNTIDVEFNGAPDGGTLIGTTFLVSTGLGPVSGTVSSLTVTKYRFVPTGPLTAGTTYAVLLKGSGTPAITEGGIALDGDPIALPSGDGMAGGNFTFNFAVN